MWDDVNAFYPSSMSVRVGNTTLPASAVSSCDLSDFGAGWAYAPTTALDFGHLGIGLGDNLFGGSHLLSGDAAEHHFAVVGSSPRQ